MDATEDNKIGNDGRMIKICLSHKSPKILKNCEKPENWNKLPKLQR